VNSSHQWFALDAARMALLPANMCDQPAKIQQALPGLYFKIIPLATETESMFEYEHYLD
jgi:hypothetical protein